MALFSKKTEENKKKSEKDNVLDMAQEPAEKKTAPPKENTGDAYKILLSPLVSEKSHAQSSKGKVIFRVALRANKISIKKAVEKVFDVDVLKVNILNVKGKA